VYIVSNLLLTFRQFEEMQHDNAAQLVTLQKALAKSSFCLQTLIYQKALPIGIQRWQFISPPPPGAIGIILSIVGITVASCLHSCVQTPHPQSVTCEPGNSKVDKKKELGQLIMMRRQGCCPQPQLRMIKHPLLDNHRRVASWLTRLV